MSSEPTKKNGKVCSTPGCGKPLRARGFCVACYYRLLRRGDLESGAQTRKWKHRLSEVNEDTRAAVCAECGPVKIRSRGNGTWRCASESNERSKLYKRAYRESKKAMLLDECEVCGSTGKLCWDHCHESGKFRGTLCDLCNTGLGFFKDSELNLRRAIDYLKKFKSKEEAKE